MKRAEDMAVAEKEAALETLLHYVQMAVESEQEDPENSEGFKHETELRINLVYTSLKELLGL